MGSYRKILLALGLQLLAVPGHAEQTNINGLKYWNTPDQTQMLFDVSSSPAHRVFLLNNPSRLVIDMRNANLKQALTQPPASHPLFSQVRAAMKNSTDVRIVVDLKKELSPKTMALRTNNLDGHGHRLVIELLNKASDAPVAVAEKAEPKPPHIAEKPVVEKVKVADSKPVVVEPKPVKELQKVSARNIEPNPALLAPAKAAKHSKEIVIAIDAGHGGNDPGAHGQNGTEEKKITLAIAKRLANLINHQSGMKAVMVRKGDYYVDLRQRMQIARAAKADLFISIHADAFQDPTVKGASVYTLSNKGATSEAARWLADSENASDLVGGVSLNDKEDVLASVLLDLSQTATQNASDNVAKKVLKNFERLGELHYTSVQKAGFMVLKSPDVPSILVETAFISNPSEETRLLNSEHQDKVASAIFEGVYNYFGKDIPMEQESSKLAALDASEL
ncbi:MAG: N-acetylmuramoyl-L-alanine amidase [Methylobacter sp.]